MLINFEINFNKKLASYSQLTSITKIVNKTFTGPYFVVSKKASRVQIITNKKVTKDERRFFYS